MAHRSRAQVSKAVANVLLQLGLGACANTAIGTDLRRGLSGGEAKRLSIGLALLSAPQMLLLDEPTSGLDSSTALEVRPRSRSLRHGMAGGHLRHHGTALLAAAMRCLPSLLLGRQRQGVPS